jgi:hypothetical protein
MPADYVIKAGDALPIFEDALTYSNGKAAEPEAVSFVMRALTATEQVALKGEAKVVTKAEGKVSFSPNTADTATPGDYMANWLATIGGKAMTFPTTGYLWVEVQESLAASSAAQLIGLPEVKDYLNIEAHDHVHDQKLIAHIEGIKPLIEQITGPIVMDVYDEWYEGGHATISLRHKPSYGFGTEPILNLMACSEYRGPIEYTLSIVPTPTQGSVYSTMEHGELGLIVRRTAGGGTYPFWRDPSHPQQSVHVVYAAGQERVPPNVKLACLEAIRVNYRTTQGTGRGRDTIADELETGPPLGFFLPRRALELLSPAKRPPVIG